MGPLAKVTTFSDNLLQIKKVTFPDALVQRLQQRSGKRFLADFFKNARKQIQDGVRRDAVVDFKKRETKRQKTE